MRENETSFRDAEATQRYKTALGRALVYDFEQGIDWKLDARGRLEPVPKSFVGELITGKVVGASKA